MSKLTAAFPTTVVGKVKIYLYGIHDCTGSKPLRLVLATGLLCLLCLPSLHSSLLHELLESLRVFFHECLYFFFFLFG